MTSLILSGHDGFRKSSLLSALAKVIGYGKYTYCTPHQIPVAGEMRVVCPDVRTLKQLRNFLALKKVNPGRQLFLGAYLTREQRKNLQEEFEKYNIRVKYLDAIPYDHLIAKEWAKTWCVMFPLFSPHGAFVVNEQVRERLKASKNLFAVLDCRNSDDREKLFKIFLDDICRPYLLAQDDDKHGSVKFKKYLVGWLNLVTSSFYEANIPQALWAIIFGYVA